MVSRRLYAWFGFLATVVGMAVGHFVASLLTPSSSPVLAVGAAVIELTPQPVASWAIAQFGSADKAILIGSVVVGVLVLAAIAGLLTRRRFGLGAGLVVLLVAVAGLAVVTRPGFGLVDVVPVILTGITGVATLWWLHRTAHGMPVNPRATSTAVTAKRDAAAPGEDDDVVVIAQAPQEATVTSGTGARRRTVLIGSAVLAVAAGAFGAAGRVIGGIRLRPEDIALPTPAANEIPPALPEDLSTQIDGLTPLRIDGADFYRVDTRLDVPALSSDGWTLTVDGDVENELVLSFDDILAMPMVERDITMTCVSNSVGGPYAGGARWLGVPLKTILDMAGVGDTADQILSTDFDGMTISTPLDLATDGREALIVVGMNGEPLPREHGFPLRMIMGGLYGFISGTKWLTRLTLTTYAEEEAYWTERNWETRAPIKPSARIDTPAALQVPQMRDGKALIGGVAWAQNDGGVSKVQVRIDGGPWTDAEQGAAVNNVYWRQWYYEAEDLAPGTHVIAARVIDGDGDAQSDASARPFPSGASGIHSYQIRME